MPVIPANLVHAGPHPDIELLKQRLLNNQTLLEDTPDHLIQVVDVLRSYGEVLDAYSINLIFQAEKQFLNPFPVFRFLDGDLAPAKLWRHFWHDRINFEYAEYCMRAMLWHGTGGMDAYFDSPDFELRCAAIINYKRSKLDPLPTLLHPLFPQFLPELIRTAATTHALGQFWRIMSDLFIDLSEAEKSGEVTNIAGVVDFIRDRLVAAAANPITYGVEINGKHFWVLPPEAKLTFLVDVAVPYVEAVFLRGTPFLGTVSFNAQARQISPDKETFQYGALFADPLPSMGAGIPPSLCMQDMYRHLPERLHQWYRDRGRGEGDVRVKICQSFQKSMFCVTNAAIKGTFPYSLESKEKDEQAANGAYALAWATRLSQARTNALG